MEMESSFAYAGDAGGCRSMRSHAVACGRMRMMQKEEGRRKKAEGRRKKAECRRKKKEGRVQKGITGTHNALL